jgi:hypothetical protein
VPELHYPDLTPPAGWHHVRKGMQVRLLPPGQRVDDPSAMIVISPLVPRHPTLPPPAELIEQSIFTEARLSFEVTSQKGPTPVTGGDGLAGVTYEVAGHVRPNLPPERRTYVVLSDKFVYYSLSYAAKENVYKTHQAVFAAVLKSLRAFRGKVIAPENTSPLLIYTD